MKPKKISTTENNGVEQPIETTKKKQIKYMLVREEGSYDDSYDAYNKLEEEVNLKLEEGWNLCGGVSVGSIGEEYFCICQAMIKEEEEYEE